MRPSPAIKPAAAMIPRTSRRFPAPGWLAGPALPVAGGRGVEETAGTFPAGVLSGLAVALAGVGEASPRVGTGVPVVTGVTDAPGDVAGEATGLVPGAAVGEEFGVTVAPGGVVGEGVVATSFTTVTSQTTSAPPPFAEPLHWSIFRGSAWVMLEPGVTLQVKRTFVPPLPEPLH